MADLFDLATLADGFERWSSAASLEAGGFAPPRGALIRASSSGRNRAHYRIA